jgi:hypothetical protein
VKLLASEAEADSDQGPVLDDVEPEAVIAVVYPNEQALPWFARLEPTIGKTGRTIL